MIARLAARGHSTAFKEDTANYIEFVRKWAGGTDGEHLVSLDLFVKSLEVMAQELHLGEWDLIEGEAGKGLVREEHHPVLPLSGRPIEVSRRCVVRRSGSARGPSTSPRCRAHP